MFNVILKVVPTPGSDFKSEILPPWYSSIILLVSERPNPHPRFLVVNPGAKTFAASDREMPFPVS